MIENEQNVTDFSTVFSEDSIEQMLLGYYREFYSRQLDFEKRDIEVKYSVDLPIEFAQRVNWEKDMYLYIHLYQQLNANGTLETLNYPYFIMYCDQDGKMGYLIRTWHSREDSDEYTGDWNVLKQKVITLQDVEAYPITNFDGKDELYDQIEGALWDYWSEYDVSRYCFYIPNMYPEEWISGAKKEWNVEMYVYGEDGRITLNMNTVECVYGGVPKVVDTHYITPPLASATCPQKSEKYYRVIGTQMPQT